tara:strand:- start:5063 stop:5647 length:585 start_codon:yes stop_codon:yes gene_type:complete
MKVIITGHTSGIGAAVYNTLKAAGHSVVGLSRSNNYNIKDEDRVVEKIISENPDVFVNNAYSKGSQTNILKKIYDSWKYEDKLIINICSVASLIPNTHEDYLMEYASDKREQRHFCEKVNFQYSKNDFKLIKCRLTNLNFDYAKTNFKSKHDKRKFPNLTPEEIANIVMFITSNKNVCIREISFHSTRSPEIEE